MDQRYGSLVHLFLVEVLVLDEIRVDEVAQIGAGVPSNVISVDAHLFLHPDHLCLVCCVGLCSWGCCRRVEVLLLVLCLGGQVNYGERETVCDFEEAVIVHADQEPGGCCRMSSCAVLDGFHHCERLELHRLERRFLWN